MDAGQRLHASFDLLVQLREPRIERKIRGEFIERKHRDIPRIEAEVDFAEVTQAAQKQPGCSEQENRDYNLPHNQRTRENPACGD